MLLTSLTLHAPGDTLHPESSFINHTLSWQSNHWPEEDEYSFHLDFDEEKGNLTASFLFVGLSEEEANERATERINDALEDWDIVAQIVEQPHSVEYQLATYDDAFRLHSVDDEPAIIDLDGSRKWYRHGLEHREHAPAVITVNGDETWYYDGKEHRPDGPSCSRTESYSVHGKTVTMFEKSMPRCREACDPTTPVARLKTLLRLKDNVVAYLAAHNPNCPEELKVEYHLTRQNDFK